MAVATVLDTVEKNDSASEESDFEFDLSDFPEDIDSYLASAVKKCEIRDPTKNFNVEEFKKEMGWGPYAEEMKNTITKKPFEYPSLSPLIENVRSIDEILEKSTVKVGFETLKEVPSYEVSKKRLKAQRRIEREKTTGKNWFNMPAPELTPEIKHDLEVIKMRSVLDPKHFYKKNDKKALPKYFQFGKVVDTPLDYYSGRLTKKERKSTIVDELMADAEFSKYNKRKYKEIISEKKKLHYKAHKHAKKLKRK